MGIGPADLDDEVRVLVRDPARLQGRPWLGQVEVATGEVRFTLTVPPAALPAAGA